MNEEFNVFWNNLYQIGITNKNDIIKELIRIKKTSLLMEKNEVALTSKIYEVMKNDVEKEVGYFPGDRDTFLKLFDIARNFNILEFSIETFRNDRMGMIMSPDYLTEYIVNMLSPKSPKSILIAEAEKYLEALKDIPEKFSNINITLQTENVIMYEMLKIAFYSYSNIEIIHQSVYKKLLLNKDFDIIISLPAFSGKLDREEYSEGFITKDTEGIAIENLLKHMNFDGNLFVIVPARFTFTGGGMSKLRRFLMEKYNIDFIFTLPEGTFRPYSSIKTYFLGISNKKKDYIEIGDLKLNKDFLIVDNLKRIGLEKLKEFDDWRIELILSEKSQDIKRFKESNLEKVKLKDIAEIFRGKAIMKSNVMPGKINVLNISNIEDGEINYDSLDTIDDEERKIRKYELIEGDVVLTCRGTVTKVALFRGYDKIIIASSNIIVIRLKKDILAAYLKIFLESPVGNTLIKSFQRGTTVMNINPSDIGELEVPCITMEKQKELAEKYDRELVLYRETIKKATEKWANIKNNIYEDMLN